MEEVGIDYVLELRQRSFFEYVENKKYKIHDIVHDLLRLISRGVYREIHVDSPVSTSDDICDHLYVGGQSDLTSKDLPQLVTMGDVINYLHVNGHDLIDRHFFPQQLAMLRTLIFKLSCRKFRFSSLILNSRNLPNLQQLRLLEISGVPQNYSLDPIGRMKHLRHLVLNFYDKYREIKPIWQLFNLRFLSLTNCMLKESKEFENLTNLKSLYLENCDTESLPESFCMLSNLENLDIVKCTLEILPENFGKLVRLRKLRIRKCPLQSFPNSLCKLSNLKSLTFKNVFKLKRQGQSTKLPEAIGNLSCLRELILDANIYHLPPGFNKIYNCCRSINLDHVVVGENNGIGWLRDYGNLPGMLCFEYLNNLVKLDEMWQNILVVMHRLEEVVLGWDMVTSYTIQKSLFRRENILRIYIEKSCRMSSEEIPLSILESFRPHPNLKRLTISRYPGNMLPSWMEDPFLCGSLQTINMHDCDNMSSLPLGNLPSLRNFGLHGCKGLLSLDEDSLPSQLEKLDIYGSDNLISMQVLFKLVSLIELRISYCSNLRQFMRESDGGTNYWLPPASCCVKIRNCILLKDWCVQQGITYESSQATEVFLPPELQFCTTSDFLSSPELTGHEGSS